MIKTNQQMRSPCRMSLLTFLALAVCVIMQGGRVTAAMYGLDDVTWKLAEKYNIIQNYILHVLGIPLPVFVVGVVIFTVLSWATGFMWHSKTNLETLVTQLEEEITFLIEENLKLEKQNQKKDLRVTQLEESRRQSDQVNSDLSERRERTEESLKERLAEVNKLKLEIATLKFDLKGQLEQKDYVAKLRIQNEKLMNKNRELELMMEHLETKLRAKNDLLKTEIESKKYAETQTLSLLDELNELKLEMMVFKNLNMTMLKKSTSVEPDLTGESQASQQLVSTLEREIERSLFNQKQLRDFLAKLTIQNEELMIENGEMQLMMDHLETKLRAKNELLKTEIESKKYAETQTLSLLDELNELKLEMTAFKDLNTTMLKKSTSTESDLAGESQASQQVFSTLEREIERSLFNQKQLREITADLKEESERLEQVNNGLTVALSQNEEHLRNETENRKCTEAEMLKLEIENDRLNLELTNLRSEFKCFDSTFHSDFDKCVKEKEKLRQTVDEDKIQADNYHRKFKEMRNVYEEQKITFRFERKTLKLQARITHERNLDLEKKLDEYAKKLDEYDKENVRILQVAKQERQQAEKLDRQLIEMRRFYEDRKSSFDKERKSLEDQLHKQKWDAKKKSEKYIFDKANLLKLANQHRTQVDKFNLQFQEIRKLYEDQKVSFENERQTLRAQLRSFHNQNFDVKKRLEKSQNEIRHLYDQIYELRWCAGQRDPQGYPVIPPLLVKPPLPDYHESPPYYDSDFDGDDITLCPPTWYESNEFGPPYLPGTPSARVSKLAAAKIAAHSKSDIMASYLIGPRADKTSDASKFY